MIIETENGRSPEWVGKLDPILLDIDSSSGEFILVCGTTANEQWEANGRPNPPYWEFRLTGNRWEPHAVEPFVFGKETNLLVDATWVDNSWFLVTLDKKAAWTDKYGHGLIRSYQTINQDSRFGID